MKNILLKRVVFAAALLLVLAAAFGFKPHPIFVSVVEIEHNRKDQTLDISCKIFTDDFEKTLKMAYNKPIDLSDKSKEAEMTPMIIGYLKKHFSIQVDGKATTTQFLGYEKIDDGIYCYLQVANVTAVNKLTVFSNMLYEYSKEQMTIVHYNRNGFTTSSKLLNPENLLSFEDKKQ